MRKLPFALVFALAMAASTAGAAEDTKGDGAKVDGPKKETSQSQQQDKDKSATDQPFVRRGPPGALPPDASGLSNKPKQ